MLVAQPPRRLGTWQVVFCSSKDKGLRSVVAISERRASFSFPEQRRTSRAYAVLIFLRFSALDSKPTWAVLTDMLPKAHHALKRLQG
jgi:hypothetical protein